MRFRDTLDLDEPKFALVPSFQITIAPNRRAAARFVTQVRRAIQKAFAEEQKKRGLSQAEIARAIGVNRSVINRELKGFKDITLGRVAELAWALGRVPTFELDKQVAAIGQNIAPQHRVPISAAKVAPTSGMVSLVKEITGAKAA